MVINIQTVLDINKYMLDRGSPDSYDSMGYNKPDFQFCSRFKDVNMLADKHTFKLIGKYKKYLNTQLQDVLSKEDYESTYNYYKNSCEAINNLEPISIGLIDSHTCLIFKYNLDFIEMIKTVQGRFYNRENKIWNVPNTNIIYLLQNLKLKGADCDNAISYIRSEQLPSQCCSL